MKSHLLLWTYLFAVITPLAYMAYLAWVLPELFWATLPEFLATSLGIVMSFALAEYARAVHAQKRAKQVLRAIKKELLLNLEVLSKIKTAVREDLKGGYLFALFKRETWEALNTILSVVRNYEIVVDLGELYWEFESINETIRLPVAGALEAYFPGGVEEGLEGIEQHINDLIANIDYEIG